MRIELKELKLQNFKGATKQTVTFGNPTEIRGANATGKTRLFDAFTWCLFGKDSEDKKDFSIKTLDADNEPLHRKDYSVTATLEVDNMEVILERTMREKWVTKKGEAEEEFQGHETIYRVNGIPHKQGEYQQKIESIIREDLFKLLTNPFYFNTVLKWTERRDMLSRMRNIQDQDVMDALPELRPFFESLNGTPIDMFKREVTEKIRMLKKDLASIPARIDENERKLLPDPDYAKVEKDTAEIQGQIQAIDKQLLDESERYRKLNLDNQEKQNRIYKLQGQIQSQKNEDRIKAMSDFNDATRDRDQLQARILNAESRMVFRQENIKNRQASILQIEKKNEELRAEWVRKNEETITFTDTEFICPTCGNNFKADDIEAKKTELTANFNKSKAGRLNVIQDVGKENNQDIETLRTEILQLEKEISEFKAEKAESEKALAAIGPMPKEPTVKKNPTTAKLEEEIEEIRNTIQPMEAPNTTTLQQRKEVYQKDLERLNGLLRIKQTNQEIRDRIAELESQKRTVSQEIATREKMEFDCQRFAYAKAKMTEEAVNGLFTRVQFKMFEKQINGGLDETCEALINGVPFPDANNAAKINAGIDIINAFSENLDIYAPIFTDNAEAVNEIIETPSQIIKLYVTTDPQLTVIK